MSKYQKIVLDDGKWVIVEKGRNYLAPSFTAITFAFDTETIVYLDGKIVSQNELYEKLKDVEQAEKRKRVSNRTWSWQVYDEYNGFFMTNDFETFLQYVCRTGSKYGWCYNATFDFAQIDYEILAKGKNKWKLHEHRDKAMANYLKKPGSKPVTEFVKGFKSYYNKHQPYTYESLHNNMGTRYAYKLWLEVSNKRNGWHKRVHAVELHDFMKLVQGGLRKLLKDLKIKDNEGNDIRKLDMDYQAVDTNNLTDDQIDYCCNDVKGLYFAVKTFNKTLEEQSNNECHCFGLDTNIMTSGGFAKRELLRSMYPDVDPKWRIKRFQKQHPITVEQDKWLRDNYLYRGGITFLNPKYKGQLLNSKTMGCPMYRYDVNSEYPYAMSIIRDLVGVPYFMPYSKWLKMSKKEKDKYECIYVLTGITGDVKDNMLGIWYNPITKEFEEHIDEEETHLMFESELLEYQNWYDLDFVCKKVLVCRRGGYAYKPFVNKNYKLKAKAKRENNKTLEHVAKLLLNSSYGKMSEHIERIIGHYALNNDTGAIHFVEDEVEIDAKSVLNVMVGALITSTARTFILKKIRAVCNKSVRDQFVYIDTDSIHAFANYPDVDAFKLGYLKLECTCDYVKYLLPKTYVDIAKVQPDGTIDQKDIELHTKGISLSAIYSELTKFKKLTIDNISSKINYGVKYIVLCALNVVGGKVLLPSAKYLARPELAPDIVINSGYDGSYLNER